MSDNGFGHNGRINLKEEMSEDEDGDGDESDESIDVDDFLEEEGSVSESSQDQNMCSYNQMHLQLRNLSRDNVWMKERYNEFEERLEDIVNASENTNLALQKKCAEWKNKAIGLNPNIIQNPLCIMLCVGNYNTFYPHPIPIQDRCPDIADLAYAFGDWMEYDTIGNTKSTVSRGELVRIIEQAEQKLFERRGRYDGLILLISAVGRNQNILLSDNSVVALDYIIEPFVDNIRLEGLPKIFLFDVADINANGMAFNFASAKPDVYIIWNQTRCSACDGAFIRSICRAVVQAEDDGHDQAPNMRLDRILGEANVKLSGSSGGCQRVLFTSRCSDIFVHAPDHGLESFLSD